VLSERNCENGAEANGGPDLSTAASRRFEVVDDVN